MAADPPRTSLEDAYAALPRIECKGLCAKSCHYTMFTPTELARAEQAAGRKLPIDAVLDEHGGHWATLTGDKKGRCPLLRLGRCTTYEARPLLCRLYGLVPSMRCPYGCEPERWLTDAEGHELLAAIAEALPR